MSYCWFTKAVVIAFKQSLMVLQSYLALRVFIRLLRSMKGQHIQAVEPRDENVIDYRASVTVIVPVLNEYHRLAGCLEGLMFQGAEVSEILVVDGGSIDGTQELCQQYCQRDPRIRLIDASPIPTNWNGKVWSLHRGWECCTSSSQWIVTIDADVYPQPGLILALLIQAQQANIQALSVATTQVIDGFGQGLLHPALLATLVYRYGIPGHIARAIPDVQANGQCFLFARSALDACCGFQRTKDSICEDVTIARMLVSRGYPVGFYEAKGLVTVAMYQNGHECWRNWKRSLPMHDRFAGMHTFYGWLEVLLIQALPTPLMLGFFCGCFRYQPLILLNTLLFLSRIGMLFGIARAYQQRPWSYWLSPLCDLPVAIQLARSVLQRKHLWRGRVIVRGG